MRELALKDAKASFSAVVEDAVQGEASVITRHGRKAAVLLGYEEWRRLSDVPSFGRLLMASGLQEADLPERDQRPVRPIEL